MALGVTSTIPSFCEHSPRMLDVRILENTDARLGKASSHVGLKSTILYLQMLCCLLLPPKWP